MAVLRHQPGDLSVSGSWERHSTELPDGVPGSRLGRMTHQLTCPSRCVRAQEHVRWLTILSRPLEHVNHRTLLDSRSRGARTLAQKLGFLLRSPRPRSERVRVEAEPFPRHHARTADAHNGGSWRALQRSIFAYQWPRKTSCRIRGLIPTEHHGSALPTPLSIPLLGALILTMP